MTVLQPTLYLKMQCQDELDKRLPGLKHKILVQSCEDQKALNFDFKMVIIDESADVVQFDTLVLDA